MAKNDYRPELIAAILVLAFIAMWFTSCMTPQKATSYLKEKGLLADTCAANYPVKPSETLKPGTVVIDSSISVDTVLYFQQIPIEVDTDGNKIGWPNDVDYTTGIVPIVSNEISQPKTIVKTIRIVERRVDTLVKTVVDSAKLSAANRKIGLLEKQLKDTEEELFKAEDKAKDRGKTSLYSIVGNGLLLLLLGFILAKKRKA